MADVVSRLNLSAEDVATLDAAGFDWKALAVKVGEMALQLIPIILGLLQGQNVAMKAAAPGCCDHRCCCAATLTAILKSAEVCSKHFCECCKCE